MSKLPRIISIVGPTASGKSSCGISIAKKFNGEIIAVDSRTVYRGMDIGTAKPVGKKSDARSLMQMVEGGQSLLVEGVPHWGIDLLDLDEDYSVSLFQEYAKKKIEEIRKRGKLPVLVGGTGLWMDAIVDNLTFPEVEADPVLRASLEERFLGDLFHEYKQRDPAGALEIDRNNKRRLIRALEVTKLTGKPFSSLRTKGPMLYDVLWLGMEVEKEELATRISDRVDAMVASGLIDEVRALKDRYESAVPLVSGIGYKEIIEFLDGDVKLVEAIENIKTNTRRFAKRQGTWFKRRKEIHWVKDCDEGMDLVKEFIK